MSDTQVKELQPAPDFTLPAIGSDTVVKNGQVQLSALRNHVVVLYFYPKDDTPGCTAEACSFRDANRETFLIDKDGIVRKVWPKVQAAEHAQEVLEAIESLGL